MLGQEYKVQGHLLCDDAHLSPYEQYLNMLKSERNEINVKIPKILKTGMDNGSEEAMFKIPTDK